MQHTMVETNQQLIEACAHMDKIMTHLNQPVSTTSPNQVQEFHQLSQIEFNGNQVDKKPTLEEVVETFMQTSNQVLYDIKDCLNRLASELVSEQEKDLFYTQLVPEPMPIRPISIQEHINFHKMNKVQTVRPKNKSLAIVTCLIILSRCPSSPHYFILINLESLNKEAC